MHTLTCVTFSLPPSVKGWLRLLRVALLGLFCLPFSKNLKNYKKYGKLIQNTCRNAHVKNEAEIISRNCLIVNSYTSWPMTQNTQCFYMVRAGHSVKIFLGWKRIYIFWSVFTNYLIITATALTLTEYVLQLSLHKNTLVNYWVTFQNYYH